MTPATPEEIELWREEHRQWGKSCASCSGEFDEAWPCSVIKMIWAWDAAVALAEDVLMERIPPAQCADNWNGGEIDCRFAELVPGQGYINNDRSEAYYMCSLLDAKVWGETPACTAKDWFRLSTGKI